MNELDFIIYTDGSANSGEHSGSACIVKEVNSSREFNIVASFGTGTNNQSEIFATFLGYALINNLRPGYETTVQLCSDSTYVLNSSTIHVKQWLDSGKINDSSILKNAHFWRVFLELTKNMTIIPKHTPGHSGIEDNEKCDNAAGWARKNRTGEEIDPQILEITKTNRRKVVFQDNWYLQDFTKLIQFIQEESKTPKDVAFSLSLSMNLYFALLDSAKVVTEAKRASVETTRHLLQAKQVMKKFNLSSKETDEYLKKLLDILEQIG